jgi:hypothetical protein
MPGWRSCLVSTCDLNRDTISRAVTDRVTVISTVTDRDRMFGLDLHINNLTSSHLRYIKHIHLYILTNTLVHNDIIFPVLYGKAGKTTIKPFND